MKIYNMNEYFQEKILQRGLNYYKKGKVISANKINDNTYIFDVDGSVNYCVKIKIHDDEYEMSCNCPYEDNCKHMAACLFYLKFNDEEEIKQIKSKKIKTKLTPFDKFKIDVKKMIRSCEGKDGYINYYRGEDFVDGIYNFAEEISNSLDNDNLDNCLKKIFYLYDTIENVEMDGSNGEHGNAEMIVSEVLAKIFFKNPQKVKQHLLTYFKKRKNILKLSTVISSFENTVRNKTEAIEYLKLIEEVSNIEDDWFLDYLYIEVNYNYIDENKALKIAENYLKAKYNSYIASFLVKKYTYLKQYDKAIKLIEKNYGKNYDDDTNLLELYLKNKNIDKYKNLLLKIYDEMPNYDYYMKIKDIFSESEVSKMNKDLMDKMKSSEYYFKDYIKICNETNDIDGLFEICKERGIEYLSAYLNKIVKKHRKEALELYKKEVKKLCDAARNRARYDKVVYYLMRLLDIPKAENVVLEIINYVESNYPTRTIFLEELDFVKNKL